MSVVHIVSAHEHLKVEYNIDKQLVCELVMFAYCEYLNYYLFVVLRVLNNLSWSYMYVFTSFFKTSPISPSHVWVLALGAPYLPSGASTNL